MSSEDSDDARKAINSPLLSNRRRRKNFHLSTSDFVKETTLGDGAGLPLVLEPAFDEVELTGFVQESRDYLQERLLKHGAVLFRGFAIDSPEKFEHLAQSFGPLYEDYGDLPRGVVTGKIYKSTPYPPDQMILFHNESSHLDNWPMKLWFYCVQPPEAGGETLIADCRQVYRRIRPDLIERFAERGLLYVRNFIPGFDMSWQDFFRTTEKSVVEEKCRASGFKFDWNGDALTTRRLRSAVCKHPKTGEPVFFNQVQLHHVSCLPMQVRHSMKTIFSEHDLPRNIFYGDGTLIEDSVVDEIYEAYARCAVAVSWQQGDVLLVDNMLAAHARNPFIGARRIMVAMSEMLSQQVLQDANLIQE